MNLFLSIVVLLFALVIAGTSVSLRRERRRVTLLIRGFDDDADAKASASAIRAAFEDAGRPRPIILNVPPHIDIERL